MAEIKPKKYSFSNLNDNLGHFNLFKIFLSLPEKSTIYFNGLQIESNVMTFEKTFVKFIELKSGNSVILKWKRLKIEADLFEVTICSEHSLLCLKAQCPLIIKEFTSKLSEEELKDVFNIFPFIELKSEYKYAILVPWRWLANYKLNSYFNSRSDKNEVVDMINKLIGNINFIFWIQTRYLFYLKDWISILPQSTKWSFLLYVDDYLINENKLKISLSKYDLCNEDFDILSSLKIVEMIAYKTWSIKLKNLICNILKMQSVKMNLNKISFNLSKLSHWLEILSLLAEWKQIQDVTLKSSVNDCSNSEVNEKIEAFTQKVGIISRLYIW